MSDGTYWQKFDYDDGLVTFQRDCPDCDHGLLTVPARWCPRCGGSGFLTETFKKLDVEARDE